MAAQISASTRTRIEAQCRGSQHGLTDGQGPLSPGAGAPSLSGSETQALWRAATSHPGRHLDRLDRALVSTVLPRCCHFLRRSNERQRAERSRRRTGGHRPRSRPQQPGAGPERPRTTAMRQPVSVQVDPVVAAPCLACVTVTLLSRMAVRRRPARLQTGAPRVRGRLPGPAAGPNPQHP
jgi:hypothetical protein